MPTKKEQLVVSIVLSEQLWFYKRRHVSSQNLMEFFLLFFDCVCLFLHPYYFLDNDSLQWLDMMLEMTLLTDFCVFFNFVLF